MTKAKGRGGNGRTSFRPTSRVLLASVAAVGVAVASGCAGGDAGPSRPQQAGELRLVAFDSCDKALVALKDAARPYVGPYGFGARDTREAPPAQTDGEARRDAAATDGGATPEKSPQYSGTTTHEAGVDEPDVVKTDGRRIVSVVSGTLRVVDPARRAVAGTLPITDQGTGSVRLLLYRDHALVITPHDRAVPRRPSPDRPAPGRDEVPAADDVVSGTGVLLVDLTQEGNPRIVDRFVMEGWFVDARMVGGTVRMVTGFRPRLRFTPPRRGVAEADAATRNREALDRSTIDDWLPRYVVERDGVAQTGRVSCERVSHPVTYSGTGMLTVSTFDLDFTAGEPRALGNGDPVAIVADGEIVYGSSTSLYIANRNLRFRRLANRPVFGRPTATSPDRTELYKFDISGSGRPRHVASGAVPGEILNQYALSEWNGHLRVATTTRGAEDDVDAEDRSSASESQVTVLAHQGDRLVAIGSVGGLGRTERIRGVRFLGPVGYVVTFRQTDPLYTVDLRDPRHPRVRGELKITGYSAYLHPVDERRLIGVGQEATEEGRELGTQVSLFDVGNLERPTRVAQHHVPRARSIAESNPHAFLYWPKTSIVVIPVHMLRRVVPRSPANPEAAAPDKVATWGGALVLKLMGDSFSELGVIAHPTATGAVLRAFVIGDTLWTLSREGLKGNDATTAADHAWIAF